MNPVDVTLDLLRPLLPALAGRLRVSTDVIERLSEGAVGGIAAGLVRLADEREGRELVDAMVDVHDRGLLGELGRHIQEHDDDGDAVAILGDKLSGVSSALAAHAGVSGDVAAKALALVAPVVLAVLRRDRATEGIAAPLQAARSALGRPGLAWLVPLGFVGAGTAAAPARRAAGGRDVRSGRRGIATLLGALALVVGGVVAIGVSVRGDGDDDDRGAVATQSSQPSPQPPPAPDTSTVPPETDSGSSGDSSLVGLLGTGGVFGNLVAALEAATDTAAAVAGAGAVTVFAPDDSALTAGALKELEADPAALDATLRYHVVPGTLSLGDLASAGTLTTLSGRTLKVTQKGGRTLVNGTPVDAAGPVSDTITIYRITKVLEPPATINEELDLQPITFETASAEITPAGRAVLDQAVAFLQKTPLRLSIEGHTDSDGEEANNLTLSRRRAIAVRNYLVAQGIPKRLLVTKAFGEANPVATNDTDAGKARNRRIELRVL